MDTMILEKSRRDGGGFGKFRAMTLEEAKALPRGSYIWLRMTNGGAQQFKTYNTGITNLKRVRLATLCFDITEREILDGQVLVEITRDEEPL